MKRVKEKILKEKEDNQLPTLSTSSSTCDPTTSYTTRSNGAYVYGVFILAVLAIGVCAFFTYNTFQPKNKKQANDGLAAQHEQKKDQPTKRSHLL